MTGTCDASITDDAVFDLVKRRCWACHASNGLAGHDFASIAALRSAPIIDMVGSCQMPPDGSALADEDRQRLVDWARCSAPPPER
jgi:hypothetical protein